MANGKSTSKSSSKKKSAPKKTGATPKRAPARDLPPPEPAKPIGRELTGVLFLCLGLFVIIGLFNTEGALVRYLCDFLKGMVGWGFYIAAPVFLFIALILFTHHGRPVEGRIAAALLLPVFFSAAVQLTQGGMELGHFDLSGVIGDLFGKGQRLRSGGVLGGLLATSLTRALSLYGAWPVTLLLFALSLILALRGGLSGFGSGVRTKARSALDARAARIREAVSVPELGDEEDSLPLQAPRPAGSREAPRAAKPERKPAHAVSRSFDLDLPLGEDEDLISFDSLPPLREETPRTKAGASRARVRKKGASGPVVIIEPPEARDHPDGEDLEESFPAMLEPPTVKPAPAAGKPEPLPAGAPGKKLRQKDAAAAALSVRPEASQKPAEGEYRFPTLDLLRSNTTGTVDGREEIETNRERLENALHSFGINASVVNVTRGPSVTRYDIVLEQGVKLARVTNLAGDLALALGVVNVRIAPIPDKISTVGIEVPNRIVTMVYLREILESPRFTDAKSKLSFALGKDISGECVVGNISKLPHLLIAGTTGSGKSVCMNSLILSLLYKATPEEVRLIMIDPKMVELGIYNGIPHLYVPVVTDPKKAAGALQWTVVEMLKRYRSFSEVGVRDLESYNRHCRKNGEATLPAIVVVIDELADLMTVASKDVEESICRVAQMGRAAGMHLVIATQRPSADVITGLMKANIPSRIAFAVSSSLESRIILDQVGAEKLIGMGDMLFSPVGMGKPLRIQGSFVSDEEREDVIQFIRESAGGTVQNSESESIEAYMNKATEEKSADKSPSEADEVASGYDEMLPQAVEVVLEMGSCSVSMLQRRIKLGYSRAARIVDQMEELGVVGPYEGAKPRSLKIDRAGWQELKVRLGFAGESDLALAEEMNRAAESESC